MSKAWKSLTGRFRGLEREGDQDGHFFLGGFNARGQPIVRASKSKSGTGCLHVAFPGVWIGRDKHLCTSTVGAYGIQPWRFGTWTV